MAGDLSPQTPKTPKPSAAAKSPGPSSQSEITSPKPVPAAAVIPIAAEIPLKDITIFTKGSFSTTGTVIRANDKVNVTAAGTPFFFFVLQDEVLY